MSLVEIEILSEEQARRLIARINGTAVEMIELIEQAWAGRAWIALGYASWDELCDTEIVLPKMDRDRRREVVGSLRQIGMSTRAIASATGVSKDTVHRDLAGVSDETPAPVPQFVDEVPPPRRPAGPTTPRGSVPEAPETGPPPSPGPTTVTGTDGKQYPTRPVTEKPRRAAITDGARNAGWDLRKTIERVQRIVADDRFPANRDQVAIQLHAHLTYTHSTCAELLGALNAHPGDAQ